MLESKFHALCKDVFYNIEIPFNPTDVYLPTSPYFQGKTNHSSRSSMMVSSASWWTPASCLAKRLLATSH